MPFMSDCTRKMLFLVNHKATVCYNKYEYVCAVLFCVYFSTLYSLQKLSYNDVKSLQLIVTDQSVSYYTLHSFVAFVQSEAFLPVQLQK